MLRFWCYMGVLCGVVAWPVIAATQVPPSAMPLPAVALPPSQANPVLPNAQPTVVGAVPQISAALPSSGMTPEMASPAEAAPAVKNYSFGEVQHSLLFTPVQIAAMKAALRAYESNRVYSADGVAVVVEIAEPEVLAEPPIYPIFYLVSIVYRNPNDWTIWVANDGEKVVDAQMHSTPSIPISASAASAGIAKLPLIRISSKSNKGELKAVHVSAERVDFAWTPSYLKAMQKRVDDKLFAPTEAVRHRVAVENPVHFDAQQQTIHFGLKQNQSFSAAYFKCFEGKISPVVLASINPPKATTVASSPASASVVAGGAQPALSAADANLSSRDTIDGLLAAEQAKKTIINSATK